MSLTANCLHLPWMISSSLKGAYEKWFFFQLWVNKLAMKVTFIELRNKNLTVSHHQMALHIFLQSLITLPIWYIYWYISYMDNIGNGDVIFWQVFPRFSSFIKKGWNWIWGYHHQFWLLNWYTVLAHIKTSFHNLKYRSHNIFRNHCEDVS